MFSAIENIGHDWYLQLAMAVNNEFDVISYIMIKLLRILMV